jgi:hypothetical protein
VISVAFGAYGSATPVVGIQGFRAASRIGFGPLLQLGAKLGDGAEGGESGSPTTVALSANGDTALVGSPYDDGGVGSVSVFTRSGSNWIQQGPPLAGSGEVGQSGFGRSVALSADGDLALIGGPSDGSPHEGQCCARGAVWVFTRSGSTWTQQGTKLTDDAGRSAEFGWSIALSAGGRTALIGAPGLGRAGAAWIFTHTRSGWQRGVKLAGRGSERNADFGSSVALASDGATALIGGDGGNSGAGAWVFTRQHSRWISQGERLSGKEHGGRPSTAVALSSDGDTALVGAGGEDAEKGAAWIFTRSGSTWQRRAKLTGRGESGLGNFGESVALSSSGKIALIGCPQEEGYGHQEYGGFGLQRIGAAWLFSGSGSNWTQRTEIVAPATSGEDGLFGEDLALSGAATTALVGVEVDTGGPGAAWVLAN